MTSELDDLLAKARESIEAAELLWQWKYYGYAASRAYYAMFYLASALLASQGQSYSSHGAVQAAFGKEFAKSQKLDPKFHRWLLDAQDSRNTGDYGIGVSLSAQQAAEICQWARTFLQAAEGFLANP